MNRQELIKRIKDLPFSYIWNEPYLNKEVVLDMIKQLDEPKKPVVPQFVADWYEECKDDLEYNIWSYIYNWETKENSDFKNWLDLERNNPMQTLFNMHQFGYEVEKEKRYRISMPRARNHKNHAQILCEKDGSIFWCGEWYPFRTKFTRKELEEAGFGWVFDCEGIEIEEVE